MFTGIVQKTAPVAELSRSSEPELHLRVRTGFTDLSVGESIAVNGICLTVAECNADGYAGFYVSRETLARSNLGLLRAGSLLNLERSATPTTLLSGHWVQGHVDGTALVLSAVPSGECLALAVELPAEIARYCVVKGSITLNGVSLTINTLEDRQDGSAHITVLLIPHTWKNTNLSQLAASDSVNVEVDVLAKYVERLCRR